MATRLPHMVTSLPRTRDGRAGFYGLGWNVSYDDRGRLVIGHAGAFYLGAATYVHLIPGEDLGIVVLPNGAPVGVPESIDWTFVDLAPAGTPSADWLGRFDTCKESVRETGCADVS